MAIRPARLLLNQGKTALFICDVQTKFSKIIYGFDKMITNTAKLINAFRILDVPMLATEQNPKAMGRTVSELDISGVMGPFAKTQGSMCTPEVREVMSKICSGSRPEAVVLVGIESHLCVEHTAVELRNEGIAVHLVADCISSRTPEDRHLALDRMKEIGCVITTSENAIFNVMRDANHVRFKDILELVTLPSSHI